MDQRRTGGTNQRCPAGVAVVSRYGFCTGITVIRQTIHKRANLLATYAFRRIFDRVDKVAVKRGVDEMGLSAFIKHCARLAATTGVVSGFGGVATMVVGVPADMLNCLTQQFRVTLAVIYAKSGDYEITSKISWRLWRSRSAWKQAR